MPRIDPPTITSVKLRDLPDGATEASDILSGETAWYRYAEAYRDAADSLVAAVVANDIMRNIVAVPALFLYRHYIELHLKSLLLDAGELLDDPQVIPPKHYLLTLWNRVRELLLRIDARSDGPWLVRADAIIAEMDDLDPTSFAFRYPVDTAGAPSLAQPLSLDVVSISNVIDELHILLNGASTQIDVYMGYKREFGATL